MNREEVQQQALSALLDNNGGTVVLDTGTGKTKVAIDFILKQERKIILILYPRNNLKQNWINELAKWGIKRYGDDEVNYYYQDEDKRTHLISIIFSTIQGIYQKTFTNKGDDFVFIIDECHVQFTETYSQFFYNNYGATFVGLTATPEDNKLDKAKVYNDIAPIVYRYKKAAEDGIINGRRYLVLRTDLSKVNTTIEGWKYPISEYEVLQYHNRKIAETSEAIEEYFNKAGIFNGNYFNSASKWCWMNKGTAEEKRLGWPYLRAISARKAFLLNQNTTVDLVKDLLNVNKTDGSTYWYTSSGILVFSNQITQIQKILKDQYIVHSKKKKEENEKIIFGFNEKVFNTIGSCESLELGMNFKRANVAIFESYVGSSTKASQKMGRTDRLPIDEKAIIIIIYINDSPCDGWYRKSGFPEFSDPTVQVFTDVKSLKDAFYNES